jgi:hypothetical protein
MKNPFSHSLTLLAIVLISFTACKKSNQFETAPPEYIASDDQVQVTAEFDAVLEDVNELIRDSSTFNFEKAKRELCDASYAASNTADTKTITITYNGNNCGARNRTRVGTVILSMPITADWAEAGAMLNVSIQHLKIRRVADQSSITLNGNSVITNVSGGKMPDHDTLSVTHNITSDGLSIKFMNDSTRTWRISKQRAYTYNNGIVINTSGTHAEGNMTGIAEWGINRAGEVFHTRIEEPLVVKQECLFKVTGGRLSYNTATTMLITYGLNISGNATSCPGYFPYYYKAAYTDLSDNPVYLIARY